jgi:hypothetical protein
LTRVSSILIYERGETNDPVRSSTSHPFFFFTESHKNSLPICIDHRARASSIL